MDVVGGRDVVEVGGSGMDVVESTCPWIIDVVMLMSVAVNMTTLASAGDAGNSAAAHGKPHVVAWYSRVGVWQAYCELPTSLNCNIRDWDALH